MNQLKLIKEKNKAKLLFREYEAILVLINQMTVDRRNYFNEIKEKIDNYDKHELREFTKRIKSDITYLRNYYGAKIPNSSIVEYLEKIEANCGKGICYVAKFKLKDIFKNYHKSMLDFSWLPEHSKIAIDLGFKNRLETEYFILEAAIFEDMCAIFNVLKKEIIESDKKSDKKKNKALMHAAVLTAFNFVEAYLNGIASDYWFKNFTELNDKTKIILTEWNHIENKPRYLSLREKALKYLRIACNSSFPPLQETNCEELAFIIERAKSVRDSIVHPSSIHGFGLKEEELFKLEIGEVEKIIDISIILVKKMETLIYGDNHRIIWLLERNENGIFPEDVFS